MKSSVVRLKRQGSYKEALDAFQSGDARLCAELLEFSRAPKAILLRARALRRLVASQEALEIIESLAELDLKPFDDAQCAVIRFTVLYEIGKPDEAKAAKARAIALCQDIGSSTLEAELRLYEALFEKRSDGFEQLIADLLERSDADPVALAGYPFSKKYWISRLYHIQAFQVSQTGDRVTELGLSKQSLQLFDECGIRDDYNELLILQHICDVAISLGPNAVIDVISNRLEKFVFAPDYAWALCRTYLNLSEAYSNLGNLSESLRLIRSADEFAIDPLSRLSVMIARADLLRDSGETLGSREMLERATDLVLLLSPDAINPTNTIRRFFDKILTLAARVATFDVETAKRIVDFYQNFVEHIHSRVQLTFVELTAADESAALGYIALGEGQYETAIRLLTRSIELYSDLSEHSIAAAIAFELANITFEWKYVTQAESWTLQHPLSILAIKVASVRRDREIYDRCAELFRNGDFTECLNVSESCDRTSVILLRALAAAYKFDLDAAQKNITAVSQRALTLRQQLEFLRVRWTIAGRTGDKELFDSIYPDAVQLLDVIGDVEARANLYISSSFIGLYHGDYTSASECCNSVYELEYTETTDVSSSIWSLEYWKAKATEVLGCLAVVHGDVERSYSLFLRALDEYDREHFEKSFTYGYLLGNIAGLSWSLGFERVASVVLPRTRQILWPADLAIHETRIYTELAESCVAQGDYRAAKRLLEGLSTRSPGSRIRFLLAESFLSREVGVYARYRSTLSEAIDTWRDTNWSELQDIETSCIWQLASASADVDISVAQQMLDVSLQDSQHRSLFDPYNRYQQNMARGIIAKYSSNLELAEDCFRRAHEAILANDIERHCSARASIEIAELSFDIDHRSECERYAEKYPSSEVARRLSLLDTVRQSVSLSGSSEYTPLGITYGDTDTDIIQSAKSLFDRGLFTECIATIGDATSTTASLIKIRAKIRLAQIAGLVEEVEALIAREMPPSDLAIAMMLRFTLSLIVQNGKSAELFSEAEEYCIRHHFYDVLAILYLNDAGAALAVGDVTQGQKRVEQVFNLPTTLTSPCPAAWRSMLYYRAQATHVRGMIYQCIGNDAAGLELNHRFFSEFEHSGDRDDHYMAQVLANTASLAISLGEKAVIELFNAQSSKITWHDDLQLSRVRAHIYFAEACAISGDQIGALRHLRSVSSMPHSDEFKIRLLVTEAIVHRDSDNAELCSKLLREAVDVVDTIEWTQREAVSKRQLLLLAEQLALTNPQEAQLLIDRFDKVDQGSISASGWYMRSNRQIACESFTRGIVAKANGSLADAKKYFLEAYDLASMLLRNFERMTAFLALELAELTCEARYLDVARRFLAEHPTSDLAARLSKTASVAGMTSEDTEAVNVKALSIARSREGYIDVFRSGCLSDVIESTRANGADVDMVLRARSFLRLGRPQEAIVASSFDYSNSALSVKTERLLIRATAHGRLGDFETAHSELMQARDLAVHSPFMALKMDVNFTSAYVAYTEREADRAKQFLEPVLSFKDDRETFYDDIALLWDADHISARAHELRAFLAGAENDQALQAHCFRTALDRVLASKTKDMWLTANIASNYGMMLREFSDHSAMDELREKIEAIEWTDDLADQRFQLARSFGMSAALSGNHVAAFRFYREAASFTQSSAARVVALVDRAILSRELGNSLGEYFADELDAIAEAASRVHWETTPGEHYVTLLLMAQLFAGSDALRATAYFERYKELHAQSGRELYGRTDPRRVAAELATAGLIAKARGDRAIAQSLLERACDGYVAVHCDWRAANVAISLLEIDSSIQGARAVAERVAQQNPASWIARRLAELSQNGPRSRILAHGSQVDALRFRAG